MKYIYQIIGGLLLCVQTIHAQIAPTPKKTEIVMTVDELRYLLEQIGKAELTTLRDKQLDSMLSAVNYKTEQMSPTSVVINEYRLVKAAAVSPTVVVRTASSTIISRTASTTAIARTASNTAIARTATPTMVVRTATNTAIAQRSVAPATMAQTQNTAAIAQQLAQLSGTVEQLRKQQQLLLAALAVNTGVVASKSKAAPTATAAPTAAAQNAPVTTATTTATTATAGYAPIVVQSVTATGVPIQISAEKRSELEQLLAAYGHKKTLLYFANNKTVPLAYDPTIIDEMVTMLQAHPELSILLEGYASAVGSAAYNNVLSMERAVAVAQILNAKGIGNERILTAFKGIDPQATPAQARRVELRVVIRSY
ncbi:OmpA family protein [Capnocytophaga leadbetteri]|uniref:OmpA family protein n=1 Tax=Capnocytophaga leadbetteri TaxID=327575 RepID=UPI0026F3562D|nr:OmpA family protein [Capnocytophaga leadbetteri]